jgi:hypothetical protein
MAVFRYAQTKLLAYLFGCVCLAPPLHGQENGKSQLPEIETKYIFGFTGGSGVGELGDKEISWEGIGQFGKRDGRYAVADWRFEYEFTPHPLFEVELAATLATHHIRGVSGLRTCATPGR